MLIACKTQKNATPEIGDFNYTVDKFADIQILRYRVPGFETLSLGQKEMIYYLSQAAIEGRDILFDQNNKHNLTIRRATEAIYLNYNGNKSNADYLALELYLKRIWMANGMHHHFSEDKILPTFDKQFFANQLQQIEAAKLPLLPNETVDAFISRITPIMFDPLLYPKRTNQAAGQDLVTTSSNNFYEGVTQQEVEEFYNRMKKPNDNRPISYGLNSKLVKENGLVTERVYKIGGMYGDALKRIVEWLEKAAKVAENEQQKAVINQLIEFNHTGDLRTFDEYAVLWVQDVTSQVDFIVGFTETYIDPLGMKASWEALINFKNTEATKRTQIISDNAQWFEDNSPIDKQFKKEKVTGVSAKVITAAMLGGDCYPSTPIGVNLPNSNWIRRDYGSKSVTIENITEAYDQVSLGNGFAEEFMWSEVEVEHAKRYGSLTNNLHTDLHECLGHGSGQLLPGVDADALRAYGSPIEESRADLFSLYYLADPIMVKLGLLPDYQAYKAAYYQFLMNGLLTQLTRIQPGKNIEQAHMRNRQLIASWVLEKGAADEVVELKKRDGKTFVVIHDFEKLRALFGQLLTEVQRIKSTGDYEAGKMLVENYAVKVNQELHTEVLARFKKLDIAPYRGFVNPIYKLKTDARGKVMDVQITYNENYVEQHLRYSKENSVLPNYN